MADTQQTSAVTPSSAAQTQPVTNSTVTSTPAKSSGSGGAVVVILVIVGVLLLCCACSGVGYFFMQKSANDALKTLEDETRLTDDELNSSDDFTWDDFADDSTDTSNNGGTTSNDDTYSSFTFTAPDFYAMPGTTVCSAQLCSDVWDLTKKSIALYSDPSCKEYSLVNTQLGLSADPVSGVWTETWTVKGCGIESDYQINFESDSTGTLFTVTAL